MSRWKGLWTGKIMGIVLFFIIFALVVLVHEFGHFIIARAGGISVVEFSIGMGPCIASFERGGTRYAIRLLPIGGACMFEGEDGKYTDAGKSDKDEPGEDEAVSETAADQKESRTAETESVESIDDLVKTTELGKRNMPFPEAPVFARIATVFAGPFFNFLLAFIFSMIIVGSYGADTPVVVSLSEDGAAMEAGIEVGDRILKLDDKKIHLYRDISLFSMLNHGEDISITYERGGQVNEVVVTPKYSQEDGRYYIGFRGSGVYERSNIIWTAKMSFYEVRYWIKTVVVSLEMMVAGKLSKDDVSGPVGVAKMVDEVYTESKPDGVYYILLNMLSFCVLLSANLGVMNLLPLPALDGGRLVFLLLEVLRGKPVPPEKEGVVHLVGMVCLMALMLLVFINDLSKVF
ncbi:MAG: site-2 protease family protein [Lachnospiraceae bacterium]|nr:site-2 protease family protein [Lachnospiraceae bacterium]